MLKDTVSIECSYQGKKEEEIAGVTFNFDMWLVDLYQDGKHIIHSDYMMGEGYEGAAPESDMVLNSFMADIQLVRSCYNLDDFLSETGMGDRESANEMFEEINSQYKTLSDFFGEDGLEQLMKELEDH